jgi:16S rRNA (guanine1207-N2)-methyltransferase
VSTEHYFSEDPQAPLRKTPHTLTLRGRTVTVQSASGTFSPGHLDTGTAVLLKYAPPLPQTGNFLDLGCGWGPLALAMALESPEATVWGTDVNERALEVATENAGNLGLTHLRFAQPHEVPSELRLDVIWSNPPIRVGKKELHALLAVWLPRLSPAGEAWLVVAKKLGSDSLQEWIDQGGAGDFVASRHETSRGFRVIRVARRSS